MPASHRATTAVATLPAVLLTLLLAGCDTAPEGDAGATPSAEIDTVDAADATDRPERLRDTLRIEGMVEPVDLRLFRTPDDFPLPFTAYVPEEMAVSADESGVVDFVAEFGGERNEDTLMHLYVFPEDTPWQEAVATAKGYKTSRGIPIGRGIEIIADQFARPDFPWAEEAYRYRYESGDQWYGGSLGVGRRGDRPFMIVTHWPVEYEEGFAPRAEWIRATWRWWDGAPLQ